LLWALFGLIKGSLVLNAIPRLMVTVFRYSQPILISSTIRYVTEPVTGIIERDITGYHLILATFVICVGRPVSCSLSSTHFYILTVQYVSFCIYYQNHNRIRVQSRGALVGLIHAHCLTMRDGIYDDVAAVTHMSSDTDNVVNLAWFCTEIWAQVVELIIGMIMLWNQLGWWCLTPILIIACKCHSKIKPMGVQS